MSATSLEPPPAQPADDARARRADRVRFALRGVGQTLITLGVVALLFVVYEVWVTNLFADADNRRQISVLEKHWEQDTVDPLTLPKGGVATLPVGKGIAILYIPRLGRDYTEAIVQGDEVPDDAQLEQGVAHYGSTALPGRRGNFAVAGHRVGKGEPFLNIDKLRAGDPLIVQTKSDWFVYRVLGAPAGADPQHARDTATGLPGREIVSPSDGEVLLPYPNHPGARGPAALMTLTTCHPKFTATHRMIVFARLTSTSAASGSAMPASVAALYGSGS
ncbi:class E sortase [uncultured Jatrophihabitans sp.]|uniref:class E sortase n=1 Tax=uncultured Jatrophihabitans sp. TaxID=1610747 RepID=UPI0035CAE736